MRSGTDCRGIEWTERALTKNMNNFSKQKFGKLTALFPVYTKIETRKVYWICLCDCGQQVACRSDGLKSGHVKSCGCKIAEALENRNRNTRKAMIGEVYGRLTVVAFDCLRKKPDGKMVAYYWCQCACESPLISIRGDSLKDGNTRSCGYLCSDVLHDNNTLDITNTRFGKLVARRPMDMRINGSVVWECDCDCGNTHYASVSRLNAGRVYSCGCTKSIGEAKIREILDKNGIAYIYNKPYFDDLMNIDGNRLKYDFILISENNLPYKIIEFDGIQHDEPIDFFGGQEMFNKQKTHDSIKNQYALSHNIPLVRIPYDKRDSMILDDLLGDKYLINKGEM